MSNIHYDPDPQNRPLHGIECAECDYFAQREDALYTWTERKNGIEYEALICGECLMEHLRELSINEVAELIGSRKVVVE